MTRDDYLQDVLDACSFFHWEILGIYKYYQIVSISDLYVQISIIHYSKDDNYAQVLDFDNNESLIDQLISVL